MSKRPFYTALGFIVWKSGKYAAKRKLKQVLPSPAVLVTAVVVAGAVAGGATIATSGSDDETAS